jgi:hypothetical protein
VDKVDKRECSLDGRFRKEKEGGGLAYLRWNEPVSCVEEEHGCIES